MLLLGLVCSACAALKAPVAAVPSSPRTNGDRMELHGGVNLFRHSVRFGPYQARDAWVGVQRGSGRPAVTLRRDQPTSTKHELAAVCMTLMVLSKLKD